MVSNNDDQRSMLLMMTDNCQSLQDSFTNFTSFEFFNPSLNHQHIYPRPHDNYHNNNHQPYYYGYVCGHHDDNNNSNSNDTYLEIELKPGSAADDPKCNIIDDHKEQRQVCIPNHEEEVEVEFGVSFTASSGHFHPHYSLHHRRHHNNNNKNKNNVAVPSSASSCIHQQGQNSKLKSSISLNSTCRLANGAGADNVSQASQKNKKLPPPHDDLFHHRGLPNSRKTSKTTTVTEKGRSGMMNLGEKWRSINYLFPSIGKICKVSPASMEKTSRSVHGYQTSLRSTSSDCSSLIKSLERKEEALMPGKNDDNNNNNNNKAAGGGDSIKSKRRGLLTTNYLKAVKEMFDVLLSAKTSTRTHTSSSSRSRRKQNKSCSSSIKSAPVNHHQRRPQEQMGKSHNNATSSSSSSIENSVKAAIAHCKRSLGQPDDFHF